MKLLVIGIDAMMPELVFNYIDEYPTLKKLIGSGNAGSYDGYVYGYGSHDNWTSMYTGLEPKEHQIIKGIFQPENRLPRLYDYSKTDTLWKVLNRNGYKVGMWKGLVTAPPEDINGYMVSGELAFDSFYEDPEIALDGHMLTHKDEHLRNVFVGDFPKRPTPVGPEKYGYTWEQLYKNPSLIKTFLDENYFEEGYEYLKQMLEYSLDNIKKVNEVEPVDLFWFYNGILDYLGHFTMHDLERTQLKRALKLIDQFVNEMINIFSPENILVLSDHGQKSFIDHFPNCSIDIQKEAFGLADQCLFTGDNIVMEARTGGFMSSLHSLKGTMILNGEAFKSGEIQNVRNIDIYPLILELFECEVPKNRKGLVPDVFKKSKYVNTHINDVKPSENQKVLFIQTCEVNVFNSYINDYYNTNRFDDIYILGPEKYRSIFLANDQVKGYHSTEEGYDADYFDNIIVPYDNKRSKELSFIKLK